MPEDTPSGFAELMLPRPKGRSVLHVVCGDGRLCREAQAMGASHVAGFQLPAPQTDVAAETPRPSVSSTLIRALRKLDRRFDLIVLSWLDVPARLEPDLVETCLRVLGDEGMLVIDTVVFADRDWAWAQVELDGVPREVPTRTLLERVVLPQAAFRVMREVGTSHHAVRRVVLHVHPRRQDILLVAARPRAGKTTLLNQFASFGVPTYSLDLFLGRIANGSLAATGSFAAYVRERFEHARINALVDGIESEEMAREAADLLTRVLPREPPLLIVDGYLLVNPLVAAAVKASLEDDDRRCWATTR